MEPVKQTPNETSRSVSYVPAEENAPVDYASAIRQWNIGSEDSAQDNAFMFSVIQICQLNERAPNDYLRYLLQKLRKSKEGEDLTPLLPCYCSVWRQYQEIRITTILYRLENQVGVKSERLLRSLKLLGNAS